MKIAKKDIFRAFKVLKDVFLNVFSMLYAAFGGGTVITSSFPDPPGCMVPPPPGPAEPPGPGDVVSGALVDS